VPAARGVAPRRFEGRGADSSGTLRWRSERSAAARLAICFANQTFGYCLWSAKLPGAEAAKLGDTDQVHRRYQNLQMHEKKLLKFLFVIPGDKALEEALHRTFAEARLQGIDGQGRAVKVDYCGASEWFCFLRSTGTNSEQHCFDRWCEHMHVDDAYRVHDELPGSANTMRSSGTMWTTCRTR
jgi:hypothetical protein